MPRRRKYKASFSTIGWLILGTGLVILSLFALNIQDTNLINSLRTQANPGEKEPVGACYTNRQRCSPKTKSDCRRAGGNNRVFRWVPESCVPPGKTLFNSERYVVSKLTCNSRQKLIDLGNQCVTRLEQKIRKNLTCKDGLIFKFIGQPIITQKVRTNPPFWNLNIGQCLVTCTAVATCVDPNTPISTQPNPPAPAPNQPPANQPPAPQPPPAGDDGDSGPETPTPDPEPEPEVIECADPKAQYRGGVLIDIGSKAGKSDDEWIAHINQLKTRAMRNSTVACADATRRAGQQMTCDSRNDQGACTGRVTPSCQLIANSQKAATNPPQYRIPTTDDLIWNPGEITPDGRTNQDVFLNGGGQLIYKLVGPDGDEDGATGNEEWNQMQCACTLHCFPADPPSNQSGGGRTFFGIILNPLELLKNWLSRLSNPANNPTPPPLIPPAVNIQPGLPPENVYACKPDSPLCIGLNKVLGS